MKISMDGFFLCCCCCCIDLVLCHQNAMTIKRKLRRNSFESRSFGCIVVFSSVSTYMLCCAHSLRRSQCQTVCRCSYFTGCMYSAAALCALSCLRAACDFLFALFYTALFCASKTINLSDDNFCD